MWGKVWAVEKELRNFSLDRMKLKNEMVGDGQRKTSDLHLKILLVFYKEQTVDGGEETPESVV